MPECKKRIGLMGGTFDPIHIGHLMLAECAYEQFALDKIMFLPSGNPPHKLNRTDGATDRQRMEMVCLAIEDNPHFELDPEEMQRAGLTYTNETLRSLKERHPDTDYYFIIGADSLLAFDTWKNPHIICQNCILLVAVRDQLTMDTMEQKMQELRERYGAEIHLLHTPDIAIASSSLRAWHRQNRSIRYYVPDRVLEYIKINGIYEGKDNG